jgi:Arc/MetJ-type ribon-helix-helix transcriptional regulator
MALNPSAHSQGRESTYGIMGGMRKTTVYLPDDLKAELGRLATVTGRSEADLIREGIRLLSVQTAAPAPRLALFDSGIPDLAERVDDYLEGFGER